MPARRQVQLTLVRPENWERQTTWGTPLDASLMTRAVAARSFLEVDETTEDVIDCTGEGLLAEVVLGRFVRIPLELVDGQGQPAVDADELAGWLAFVNGVAAAPSGGVNEVQTITGTATGGSAMLEFERAYNRQRSAALTFDESAADIQTALRAMSNIGSTGVVAAGGPLGTAPVTVTFQGPMSNENVRLLELISSLTGGTWAIVETTPGEPRLHLINPLGVGLYTLPFTTFYLGHRGSSRQPTIVKNAVVGDIRIRAEARGKVSCTLNIIASADLAQTVGFVMPECVDIEALHFGDCALLINGVDLLETGTTWATENNGIPPGREFEYYFDNQVLTGTHAFTGKGIDITRLERATQRSSGLNIGALGESGDTLYNMAVARTTVSASLRIGPADGSHVICNIPQGLMKFEGRRVDYTGEAAESTLRPVIRPKTVKGDANTPSNVVAATSQAGVMLDPA